ncbi:MAP KINASE 9 family protein [Dorcoceras hygrometricum]|uniref:MAP KINASE 9 family protein n=1 Tax=Dorcoceras hygrometricum TaxID=472368 RepID=A0A2Z7BTF5_9LAMI|nr:MAP KINASE 9 family protein [Dorcoceras hygrometricum]
MAKITDGQQRNAEVFQTTGNTKLVYQFDARAVQEQFRDQAQRRFGEVQNGSRANQVQRTSAVFKCRCIDKRSDQVQFYVKNWLNQPVKKKGVIADDLDEMSEWTKRTSKHTVTLDEKNRVKLLLTKAQLVPSILKFYLNRSHQARQFQPALYCYLAGHVQHSRDFPGAQIQKLTRTGERSTRLSRKHTNSQLLRVPSPTSNRASYLVSIERATQYELIATGLASNNGGKRRQFAGEGFE